MLDAQLTSTSLCSDGCTILVQDDACIFYGLPYEPHLYPTPPRLAKLTASASKKHRKSHVKSVLRTGGTVPKCFMAHVDGIKTFIGHMYLVTSGIGNMYFVDVPEAFSSDLVQKCKILPSFNRVRQ